MADLACPHGFAKPSQCVDCMMDGPVAEPPRWRKVGTRFSARYDGTICTCGGTIDHGDYVQRWDYGDERTAYLHDGCTP